MPRSAVFLSGWEYNRLLNSDPIIPRQSALPAEVFWNGAAQFWFFEKVYCTQEAYDGEIAAANVLNWSTGRIFEDLKAKGFLEPKSLATLSQGCIADLRAEHQKLRSSFSEQQLLAFLSQGDHGILEDIKQQLLTPVFKELNCVTNFSPNSIVLWRSKETPTDQLPRAFDASKIIRAGFDLCRPPGKGLHETVVRAQRRVESTIQSPMIPDLLVGNLSQADYMAALMPSADVYKPINVQLWADYQKQIPKLEYLRDIASKDLWPNLHKEWLPRLEIDPSYRQEFETMVRDAVMRSKYDPYLEYFTIFLIAAASTAVGYSASMLAGLTGLPAVPTATAAVATTGGVLAGLHSGVRKGSDTITAFLQKAKATSKG